MNIDLIITKWEEKHLEILTKYSKGSANNEVMQMYRSQLVNVLEFIEELKRIKNIASNNEKLEIHYELCDDGGCNAMYIPILLPINTKIYHECGVYKVREHVQPNTKGNPRLIIMCEKI